MEKLTLIDTNANTIEQYSLCGYNNQKNEGYKLKIAWLKEQFTKGLRHKILVSEKNEAVGAIEYTPGENAWRGVNASGYLFIHCIYIMKKEFKGQGYGQLMLEACLEDARSNKFKGVAVVSRKGSWMAKKELFEKNGFKITDQAPEDFILLSKTFIPDNTAPSFTKNWDTKLKSYPKGLILIGSAQCPYVSKAFKDISSVSWNDYKIKAQIIIPTDSMEAQIVPCAFGSFAIIYNNKLIAGHPISATRFKNIISKMI